jgi:hypothetical protein
MKYSIVAASALATMALAKPAFTNLEFDIVEGEPFTLSYSGCDSGCTILLQQGQEGQPPVQELTSKFDLETPREHQLQGLAMLYHADN